MNRSMLLYQELGASERVPAATLVGLHGYGADVDQLVSLTRDLRSSFECVLPQAVRPVTPAYRAGWEADGYTWYFAQEVGRPEPATFGESLWQLEQFVHDVTDRSGRRCVLVGFDQGAVLALTLAGVATESLSGVAALCGCLPEIRGWSPPVQNLNGLPMLLVQDSMSVHVQRAVAERTIEELGRRGANLHVRDVPGVHEDPARAAADLQGWLNAHVSTALRSDDRAASSLSTFVRPVNGPAQ